MGKKSNLDKSRKDYENYESNFDSEENECFYIEDKKKDYDKYNEITINIINSELLKYSQENAYPLCEFLDYNSTKLFIQYILSK